MPKTKGHRKFKGFAALDRRGTLLWGTLRPSADEAKRAFDRHNPDPTGQGMGERIVAVAILIEEECA